jgi:hypothetical protein
MICINVKIYGTIVREHRQAVTNNIAKSFGYDFEKAQNPAKENVIEKAQDVPTDEETTEKAGSEVPDDTAETEIKD